MCDRPQEGILSLVIGRRVHSDSIGLR
jgi:hypothetical protein